MSTNTHDHCRTARPSKADLAAQASSLLPDLSPESTWFRTAVLFLASRGTPVIDRLAARTGSDREFVAVRARRWADHSLWGTGAEGRMLDSALLAHAVEVGEGLVLRPADCRWEDGERYHGESVPSTGSEPDGDLLLASLWADLGLAA